MSRNRLKQLGTSLSSSNIGYGVPPPDAAVLVARSAIFQLDHIQPVALGGTSTEDNLQLLCGSCNLRRGVKTFGPHAMKRE